MRKQVLELLILSVFYCLTFQAINAHAEEGVIVSTQHDPLEIKLEQRARDLYVLLIDLKLPDSIAADAKPNVFSLSKPSRMVADIVGVSPSSNRNITLRHPLFNGIRIGRHANKTRIVLDLASSNPPSHSLLYTGNSDQIGIKLEFAKEDVQGIDWDDLPERITREDVTDTRPPTAPVVTIIRAIKEAKIAEQQQVTPDLSMKASQDLPADTAEREEAKAKVSQLTGLSGLFRGRDREEKVDSKKSTVTGIFFRQLPEDNSSALMVDVEPLGKYFFYKKSDTRFDLVIPKASLASDALIHPQFPPENITGFEVVLARDEGPDVLVKVFVINGITVEPFRKSGKLWLKAKSLSKD